MTTEEAAGSRSSYKKHLDAQLLAMDGFVPNAGMLGGQWSTMLWPGSAEGLESQNLQTGVDVELLRDIGMASVRVPVDFVSTVLPRPEPPAHDDPCHPFAGGPYSPA